MKLGLRIVETSATLAGVIFSTACAGRLEPLSIDGGGSGSGSGSTAVSDGGIPPGVTPDSGVGSSSGGSTCVDLGPPATAETCPDGSHAAGTYVMEDGQCVLTFDCPAAPPVQSSPAACTATLPDGCSSCLALPQTCEVCSSGESECAHYVLQDGVCGIEICPESATPPGGPVFEQDAAGGCIPPPAGLISWWRGDGNALDSVGANSGSDDGAVTYVAGVVGQAFHFDGSSYVTAPATDLPLGDADRTIELWGRIDVAYTTPIEGLFAGYGSWGTPDGTNEMLVYADPVNSLVYSQWGESLTAPTVASTNTWFHFAFTLSAGTSTLYVNGSSAAVDSSLAVNTPSGAVFIGAYPNPPDGTPEGLTGDVDELSIYSRALTGAEIQAIYSAGGLGKCK
jgi:concanavalin A-like lectin/glucanase superfamily protein